MSVRLVRRYGLLVGTGLLVEGGALLLLEALGVQPGDTRHNALHVVWGIALLALLTVRREALWTLLVVGGFGAFYTALAVVGVLVERPFGLVLGPGENSFHFIVGPLALLLALQGWSSSDKSADSVSSAASRSASG